MSLLLLPLYQWAPTALCVSLFVLATDGVTQLLGWRTSNNPLRFITGLATAAAFLPAVLSLTLGAN